MQDLQNQKKAILEYDIYQLDSEVGLDAYIEDLHHHMFNMDYFIIGTYKASKFIGSDLGKILEVCPMRGCWINIGIPKNPQNYIRVKVTDGEIVFPLSSKGKNGLRVRK